MPTLARCTDTTKTLVGSGKLVENVIRAEVTARSFLKEMVHVVTVVFAEVVDGKRLVFAVDNLCDFFNRSKRQDWQDTREDFLCHQFRVFRRFSDNCRLDEASLRVNFATADNSTTTGFDDALNPFTVELVYHHALIRGQRRVAIHVVFTKLLLTEFCKLFNVALVHKCVVWCDANLSRKQGFANNKLLDCRVNVS